MEDADKKFFYPDEKKNLYKMCVKSQEVLTTPALFQVLKRKKNRPMLLFSGDYRMGSPIPHTIVAKTCDDLDKNRIESNFEWKKFFELNYLSVKVFLSDQIFFLEGGK